MLFSTTTLGIVGSVLGIFTGVALLLFDLASFTAAGSESTADVMGLIAMVLGVVGLVAVAVGDRHHTLSRSLYLFAAVAGFLVAAVLWIPAGLFLALAGLTGILTRPERREEEGPRV